MLKKRTTLPDLLPQAPEHQKAKALGLEHFTNWNDTRSIRDKFKNQSNEEIIISLQKDSINAAALYENLISDFNLSSAARNFNNFNLKEMFYVGEKKIDRRGAVGCLNYTPLQWLPTMNDVIALKEKYTLIAIDNLPGAKLINDYDWNKFSKPPLVVFGSEGVGISPTMISMCEEMVAIESRGSVRSINIASAAAIVFYDISNKLRK
jgi:tRNA(Leu) C34 or U34 (ribose-2'-O)-methylase TrmL